MRLMTVDQCEIGERLAKTIFHENGSLLLAAGTELTGPLIAALKKYNITTIYIEDDVSEGIEVIDSIPHELRIEAANVITEGLDQIANLEMTNVKGMMKSGRIIRSFQKVFRDIMHCLTENPTTLNLLASTKVHENHVYQHSLNVAIYACQLGIENGLPIKNIQELGLGAMLHDLGKLYVSPEILNKRGKLTAEEFEQIKAHSEKGFEIIRKIHEVPIPSAHCAYQHHERLDGMGYPRGLCGNEIHKYAKILSVCDVFDAVTSHRAYRQAMLPHKAIELLYSGSGTQFDPMQVQLFKDCVAIYPQGITVQLNDGRIGIVSSYNYKAAGRPIIRVIKDEEQNAVIPYEIDLSHFEHMTLEIINADTLI